MTDPLDELAEYLRELRDKWKTDTAWIDKWLTALEGVRKDARRWNALDKMMREGGSIEVNSGAWQAILVPSIDAAIQEL